MYSPGLPGGSWWASTLFYATGRTKLYILTGTVGLTISMPVTYFLIASPESFLPGLGLGALGVALQMVALQLFTVNIILYIISRLYDWSYEWSYQLIVFIAVLGMSLLARHVALIIPIQLLWQVTLMLFLYGGSLLVFVFVAPGLVGLPSNAIDQLKQLIIKYQR